MARSGVVVILFCYFQISITKYIKDGSPTECIKYGVCARTQDYPTGLARKLIAELKAQNTIFNVDEPEEPTTTLESRFAIYDDVKRSLCNTMRKSWPPSEAIHESGKREIILNDDVPSQVFNVELCSESKDTRGDVSMLCRSNTVLLGYQGECIQKTRLKEMYYIEGNQTARGYFFIPTGCSCELKISE